MDSSRYILARGRRCLTSTCHQPLAYDCGASSSFGPIRKGSQRAFSSAKIFPFPSSNITISEQATYKTNFKSIGLGFPYLAKRIVGYCNYILLSYRLRAAVPVMDMREHVEGPSGYYRCCSSACAGQLYRLDRLLVTSF